MKRDTFLQKSTRFLRLDIWSINNGCCDFIILKMDAALCFEDGFSSRRLFVQVKAPLGSDGGTCHRQNCFSLLWFHPDIDPLPFVPHCFFIKPQFWIFFYLNFTTELLMNKSQYQRNQELFSPGDFTSTDILLLVSGVKLPSLFSQT